MAKNERKTVSRLSAKRHTILKIFTFLVLFCSTASFAFAPVAIYWATFLTASAVGFLASQAHTNGATGRTIALYASRGLNFAFNNQNAITYGDWEKGMDGEISQGCYAIPVGSHNGVALTLNTPARDVAKQITDNPSQYPNTTQSLASSPGAATSQGSWGVGNGTFDESLLPQVGDIIAFSDGGYGKITGEHCTGGGSSPATLRQCSSPYNVTHNGQFQPPGTSGCTSSGTRLYIWAACDGYQPANPSSIACARWYNISRTTAPPPTDESMIQAMQANPSEVARAQQDLYQSKNGGGPSGSAGTSTNPWTGEKFPSAAGGGKVTYPGTKTEPTAGEILGAVDAANAATADSGVSRPNTDDLPLPVTTTTTTTRTRGQVTVSTDPQTGARTVSYPTTVRTIDAEGNVIDEQIEYFVGTYPAGATLPAEVQAAVDGVAQSTTTTKAETKTLPANLTNPDLVPINWDGLLVAVDAMRDRFPFSILAGIATFLDSFYVEPETPHFTMVLCNEEFEFSMEWLDSLALLWRNMIKAVILAFTAYFCLHILMR